jgi:RNA polymerase-binding protein DksA
MAQAETGWEEIEPMATSRKKSAARKTAARSGSRATKPARAATSSTKQKASKPVAPKKAAAKSSLGKPGAAKTSPAKAKPAKGAVAKKAIAKPSPVKPAAKIAAKSAPAKPAKKALPPGKTKADLKKLSDSAAKRAAQAEVRPLGVLPPESMVRSNRPAPPVARSRPAPSTAHATTKTTQTSGQGATRVTDKDLKEFEGRLLEERRKILKEMGHLENTVLKVNQRDSSGDLSGYSFHMADAGTDAMEREKAFMFASAEGRVLLEINEALRRVYRGEFGICESCGQPIGRGRLEAMPMARLCLACKEKEERAQRGAPQ